MRKFRPRRFWHILEGLERILFRVLIVGFVILALTQLALPMLLPTDLTTRTLILNDAFEGEKELLSGHNEGVKTALKANKHIGSITFRLDNFSSLQRTKVLVNGQEITDFNEKEVTIGVNDGDEVVIDGSFYKPVIKIRIIELSDNIKNLKLNQEILITSEIVSLGEVRVEE